MCIELCKLQMACVYGHIECARLVLSAGADVWRRDDKEQSSLHKACTLSSSDIVSLLIKSVEDNHGDKSLLGFLDMEDSEKNTPLMISIESGNYCSAKVAKLNWLKSSDSCLNISRFSSKAERRSIFITARL